MWDIGGFLKDTRRGLFKNESFGGWWPLKIAFLLNYSLFSTRGRTEHRFLLLYQNSLFPGGWKTSLQISSSNLPNPGSLKYLCSPSPPETVISQRCSGCWWQVELFRGKGRCAVPLLWEALPEKPGICWSRGQQWWDLTTRFQSWFLQKDKVWGRGRGCGGGGRGGCISEMGEVPTFWQACLSSRVSLMKAYYVRILLEFRSLGDLLVGAGQ